MPGSRTELRQRIDIYGARFRRGKSLLAWSKACRLEEGGALDFDAFPFQVEIYEAFGDAALPVVDVMKSAQCGISAAGVSLALYAADVWQASVLYVLPGFDDAWDFSDTRVKTAIDASQYLMSRVAATDNKGLKRVGEAFIYFRGSGSERKALSIPADLLILDELDRLDQRNVPRFEKRLNAPTSMRLRRRFSNPSYPETGIHECFLASDQRHWLIRCGSCKREAPIFWDIGEGHYVDEKRKVRACGRCKKPLKPEVIAAGRWVPARTKRATRGYAISRLIVPNEDVPALIQAHHKTDEESVQAHYNFDLGLPYSPRGGSLSRELVLACRRDYMPPQSYHGEQWVSAGVDVGKVLHVRVSRHLPGGDVAPLYIGEVDDFTELSQIWDRFGVNFGIVDERPEERQAREFMNAHRGRVMLLRWSGSEQRDPVVVDDDHGLVIARRTGACDRLVAQIMGQVRLLSRDIPSDYVKHLSAPHRVVETNSRGQKSARYESDGKADHYFFAELHDLIAREVRGSGAVDVGGEAPLTIRERVQRRRR